MSELLFLWIMIMCFCISIVISCFSCFSCCMLCSFVYQHFSFMYVFVWFLVFWVFYIVIRWFFARFSCLLSFHYLSGRTWFRSAYLWLSRGSGRHIGSAPDSPYTKFIRSCAWTLYSWRGVTEYSKDTRTTLVKASQNRGWKHATVHFDIGWSKN